MNPQKKKREIFAHGPDTNHNNNNSNNDNNIIARKPRRSIKAEGSCLNGMLKDGCAKVIDASKLGKRLSSEIWNSFGAIQVQDNFTYPSIDTKLVPEGSSTLRICQFFVACSRCFSVFKYDGHAYGTTGLVKHVKICHGKIQRNSSGINNTNTNTNSNNIIANNNFTSNSTANNQHNSTGSINLPAGTTVSVPSSSNTTTTTMCNTLNGPTTLKRIGTTTTTTTRSRNANNQPSVRHLAKVIEELRNEQMELKQKIHEMINLMGSGYVGQIQIISNEGDKVEDEMQKSD